MNTATVLQSRAPNRIKHIICEFNLLYLYSRETVVKIGDGPKENVLGVANIRTQAHGQDNGYSVNATQIRKV